MISAVVITLNEASRIEACLSALKFCDEIIVLDGGSTDGTLEIARRFTDKLFQSSFDGFASQKTQAITHATHPWVLSVDADEIVSSELKNEILSRISTATTEVGFSLPRKTVHLGRWIRHGGWYPNRLVRVFKKDRGTWQGGDVHEYWVSDGEVGELKEPLLHYSFRNLADQVARNNRYSGLAAETLKKEGKHFSTLKLVTKPLVKFVETYFAKRGFLDGYPGFIISTSAAYAVFLKWAKLWELEHTNG